VADRRWLVQGHRKVSVARFAPIGACRPVRDDHLRDGWAGRVGSRSLHRPEGRRQGAVHLGDHGPGVHPAGGGGRGPALGWPRVGASATPHLAEPAVAGASRAGRQEEWADWGGWGPAEEHCSRLRPRTQRPAVVVEPRRWRLALVERWRPQPRAVAAGPRHLARAGVARCWTQGWPGAGRRQVPGERGPGQTSTPGRGLAAGLERRRWQTRWWGGSAAWALRRPARPHDSVATTAQPDAPRLAAPPLGRPALCRGWLSAAPGRRPEPWGWVGPGGAVTPRRGRRQPGQERRGGWVERGPPPWAVRPPWAELERLAPPLLPLAGERLARRASGGAGSWAAAGPRAPGRSCARGGWRGGGQRGGSGRPRGHHWPSGGRGSAGLRHRRLSCCGSGPGSPASRQRQSRPCSPVQAPWTVRRSGLCRWSFRRDVDR
jgi:hypothetical protein